MVYNTALADSDFRLMVGAIGLGSLRGKHTLAANCLKAEPKSPNASEQLDKAEVESPRASGVVCRNKKSSPYTVRICHLGGKRQGSTYNYCPVLVHWVASLAAPCANLRVVRRPPERLSGQRLRVRRSFLSCQGLPLHNNDSGQCPANELRLFRSQESLEARAYHQAA